MLALTGANGFIGSYLADQLPFPQKRLTRNHSSLHLSPHCEWVQGDLRNITDIQNLISHTSTLIHLACTSNPRSSNENIIRDVEHNLIPTLQLFEAFASSHPEGHIIFTSSGGNMYDASLPGAVRTEDDLPCPRSSYATHKLTIEHYLRQLCEKYKVRGTILRISNPYGTLLPTKRAQGLIGVAFAKLLAGDELPIFDSLESVRDYIHLEDVSRAFQLILRKPPLQGECRLFNLSSGFGFTNAAVLDLIDKTTHLSLKRHYPSSSLPAPTWSVLSYAKIQQALGWTPSITLEDGMQRMWESILQQQPHLHSLSIR